MRLFNEIFCHSRSFQQPPAGGGFLVGADDVVQPFSLPRYQHLQLDTTAGPSTSVYVPEISPSKSVGSDLAYDTRHLALDVVGDDNDEDMEEAMAPVGEDLDAIDPSLRVPKTMLELAAASAKPHDGPGTSESDLEEIEVESGTPEPPARRPARKTTSRKPTGASKTPTRSSARVQSTPVRPTPSGSTGTRRSTRKRAREEDDDELQSSESHAEAEASTSRRPTRAQKAVVVPSTIEKRVLRPRKPKPTTQYVDEDEMDDGDEEDE
jgi:xeroderma pigmentosum group C-complementing protein